MFGETHTVDSRGLHAKAGAAHSFLCGCRGCGSERLSGPAPAVQPSGQDSRPGPQPRLPADGAASGPRRGCQGPGSGLVGLLFPWFPPGAQNPPPASGNWAPAPAGVRACRWSGLAFSLFPRWEGGSEPTALTRNVLAAGGPPAPLPGGWWWWWGACGPAHAFHRHPIKAAGGEGKCKLSSRLLPPEDAASHHSLPWDPYRRQQRRRCF